MEPEDVFAAIVGYRQALNEALIHVIQSDRTLSAEDVLRGEGLEEIQRVLDQFDLSGDMGGVGATSPEEVQEDPIIAGELSAIRDVSDTMAVVFETLEDACNLGIEVGIAPAKLEGLLTYFLTLARNERVYHGVVRRCVAVDGGTFKTRIHDPIILLSQSMGILNHICWLMVSFIIPAGFKRRPGLRGVAPPASGCGMYAQHMHSLVLTTHPLLLTIQHRIDPPSTFPDFHVVVSNSSFKQLLVDTIFLTNPWVRRGNVSLDGNVTIYRRPLKPGLPDPPEPEMQWEPLTPPPVPPLPSPDSKRPRRRRFLCFYPEVDVCVLFTSVLSSVAICPRTPSGTRLMSHSVCRIHVSSPTHIVPSETAGAQKRSSEPISRRGGKEGCSNL